MLLENIYSTGITHANCHLQLQYFYSTGPCGMYYKDITIVNDTYRVVSTSCQYDHHSDGPRGVFTLLENIYGTRIMHVDRHLQWSHSYGTSTCGLYYKDVSIVNDDSRVFKSNAPSCGVTYDRHSDDPRSVMFAPRKHLQYRHHSCRSSFTVVIFL
jgi:hypothetical protein